MIITVMRRVCVRLPYRRPPRALHGNARSHWAARHRDTQQVRRDVAWLVRREGLPNRCEHLTVRLEWAPGDRRTRDADNLWPLLKACCDALSRKHRNAAGLGLVPDDSPQWMTKEAPVIRPPDDGLEPGLYLVIAAQC